jgi:hypothetical protein
MDCCVAVIMFVCGIVLLAVGKLPLGGNRVADGAPARIAGGLLMLGPILGFGFAFLYGASKGFEAAQRGGQVNQQQLQKEINIGLLMAVEYGCFVLFGVLAVGTLLIGSHPPRPKRRFDEDEFGDHSQPRRGDYGDEGMRGPYGGSPGPEGDPNQPPPLGPPDDRFRQ